MNRVDFSKLKFLIAEDNRFMREICRTILASYGARDVVEATDGAEALEFFKERVPDIIILDLHMPILDGFDVLRMVRDRATSPNPCVPVIVMSAHSERSRIIQARDLGANEYLVKPVSARAIYSRVANIVLNPRPFIETRTYFGPDRRRFVMPTLNREDRRVADIPEKTVRLIDV
jgi:two-component system, chemotaxis family, chemotaxis protein CheY